MAISDVYISIVCVVAIKLKMWNSGGEFDRRMPVWAFPDPALSLLCRKDTAFLSGILVRFRASSISSYTIQLLSIILLSSYTL